MKLLRLVLLSIFAVALTACGGGSSSGGGGGGGTVYNGTSVITASAPGVAPFTLNIPITITISGGMVTILDNEGTGGTAPLAANGTEFVVPVNFRTEESGVACNFSVVHSGTIAGNTISGTVSGSSPCSAGGTTVNVSTKGTFSATQTGVVKTRAGNSFSDLGK